MEEEEEKEMEIDDEMDDPEVINPYEIEEGELSPPPDESNTSSDTDPEVETEVEDETEATTIGTITRAPYHSVDTLEDQMRGLMLKDREEKEILKKKLKPSEPRGSPRES
nr:hypothetical protein [Tanacetum cinerariifolium]